MSLLLAAGAHRLGGAMVPDDRVAAMGWMALLVLGVALTGRERSFGQITAIVLGTQAMLHVGFSVAAPAAPSMSAMSGHLAGATSGSMQHLGGLPRTGGPAWTGGTAMTGGLTWTGSVAMTGGLAMIGAHLLAATATAWWLRRGERAAWAVLMLILGTVMLMVVVRPSGPPQAAPVGPPAWFPTLRYWQASMFGRAPPMRTRTDRFPG